MEALFRKVNLAFAYCAVGALALIVFFVALSTVQRYFFSAPLPFTEELVGLLYFSLVFLTIAHCLLIGRHIRVTVAYDLLPDPLKPVASLISLAGMLVFCGWIAWLSKDFIDLSIRVGARSDVMRMLLWPWMCLLPVAMVSFFIAAIVLRNDKPKSGE